eukprot:6738889-Ditylum_brightwellii.AAC.1
MRVEDLKQYKDKHCNCNVPNDQGSLAKRVAMLQNIDFDVNIAKSYNKRGPLTPASSSSSTNKKSTPKESAEASVSNWEEMYQQL